MQHSISLALGSQMGEPIGLFLNSYSFHAPLKSTLALLAGTGSPTFTRATIATVVDFEGLVKNCISGEARFTGARRVRNLVGNSGNLTSGWTYTDITNVIGATDPEGGATAYTLTATGANKQWIRYANLPSGLASGVLGWSVWIKRRTGTGNIALYKTTGASQAITPTTSWQRFFVSSTGDAAGLVGIIISASGDAIDVWHPMAEEITGQANQNPSEYVSVGVLSAPYHGANVDGVKYFETENGNTVASSIVTEATGAAIADATLKGYLAEGARTNLCLQSENFGTTWTTAGTTPTRSAAAKYCGAVALDLLGDDDAGAAERYVQTFSFTADAVKAFSFFVAQGTSTTTLAGIYDNIAAAWRCLGFVTWSGGVPSVAMSVGTLDSVEALGNGVYRVKLFAISVTAANQHQIEFRMACDAAVTASLTGTVYLGGVQVENAAFSSSYVPTTTAAVVRNADVLTYPTSGNLDNTAGTCYVEFSKNHSANGYRVVGTGSALYNSPIYANSSGGASMYDGTNDIWAAATGLTGIVKAASSWGGSVQTIVAGGVAVGTGTGAFDGNMGMTAIGPGYGAADGFFGNVRNIKLWQKAAENAALIRATA